jgi:hypothetical protein
MRSAADFLEGFALPLVAGGEAAVGKPLSVAEVEEMARQLPHASEAIVAIDEARDQVLAELVVRPPALVFDTDELLLVAAVHNLLFLAHPRADTWSVTDAGKRKILETAYAFASQPLPRSRIRVLARHGLLHNLFDLKRYDIRLSWWTGSAEYFGQKPPTRLLAWRSLRRVREEVSVAEFSELLGEPQVAPVLLAILRRSPLTQLITVAADGPRLHWEDAAFILRDAELARAVTYNAIAGSTPAEKVAAPARLAAAFEQMLERAPSEADVRAVTAFLIYLCAMFALAEIEATPRGAKPPRKSPLLSAVLAADRAGNRPRGLATLFALPAAVARVEPDICEPPGLRDEPALAEYWDRFRHQANQAVGDGVISSLAERLRRHLTVLESAPEQLDGAPAQSEPAG